LTFALFVHQQVRITTSAKQKITRWVNFRLVGDAGFEPATSAVWRQHSTAELIALSRGSPKIVKIFGAFGAAKRTRTSTILLSLAPEASVSTNSTIAARFS
jgi:hypothetical protein